MENIKPGDRMQHLRTGEPFRFAETRGETVIAQDGHAYPQGECRFIGDTGFIPFADAANATDEGKSLLAEIRADEMEWANLHSRVLYGRNVDALDLLRLRRVVKDAKQLRREKEQRSNPAPGTCWQCDSPTGSQSIECRPCHEGIAPASYNRMVAREFLSEPRPLPAWMNATR